ncbi:MAG: hypothetical protein U0872_14600 [Planctomycetaceae bacterium]
MPLTNHPTGNYRFLPGIAPYSCGVIADAGYEIVHVKLAEPVPWRTGFDQATHFLAQRHRPKAALCAIELRSPRPFTFAGFSEFNQSYAQVLKEWEVFVDGVNPVARTNVAPELDPPAEPVLYGFSFTQPSAPSTPPTFVVAGAGELPEGILARQDIVALGDLSEQGLSAKARFVVGLMQQRLKGLGVDGSCPTALDVYTVHDVHRLIVDPLLQHLPAARRHGIQWHYTRPPIIDVEFEMDLRGVRTELVMD